MGIITPRNEKPENPMANFCKGIQLEVWLSDVVRGRVSVADTFMSLQPGTHKVSLHCKTNITRRQGGLTIRGPHTNVRLGHFSHTRMVHFFPKKVADLFSRRRLSLH